MIKDGNSGLSFSCNYMQHVNGLFFYNEELHVLITIHYSDFYLNTSKKTHSNKMVEPKKPPKPQNLYCYITGSKHF